MEKINYNQFDTGALKKEFHSNILEFVVIDNFLDEDFMEELYTDFPNPEQENISKSRDYIFAKNKYEKSNLSVVSDSFSSLKGELLSEKFKSFLKELTDEDVFVDPEFHGGGLHQGGKGSYLNMHTDFNYHPEKNNWFRNLNILIYANKNWEEKYKGELKLENKNTGKKAKIEPLFNRCVIMFTRDYTLHGYDAINFPDGDYRRSIAAYAYSIDDSNNKKVSSTKWYVEDAGPIKSFIGLHWPKLVKIKTKIFGSATSKNK